MPSSQKYGPGSNPFVFTNWLAGGGFGGVTHGESDLWGYKPLIENPTQVYDAMPRCSISSA